MKYKITENGFYDFETGEETSSIKFGAEVTSDVESEWQKMQAASAEDYHITHSQNGLNEYIREMFKLFNCYISASIQKYLTQDEPNHRFSILDIGCGTYKKIPLYIDFLASKYIYVGLDPFNGNNDREYLFINSRVEDIWAIIDHTFDVFIFSTSLDHIENPKEAYLSLKKVARKGSICLFFVGLHDVEVVAKQLGIKLLKKVPQNLKFSSFLPVYLKSMVRIPKYFISLKKRDFKLKNNIRLDNKHFHYFTSVNILNYLDYFGEIIDISRPPNTNALFACVRLL